ncbi:hypothetical protein JAAARDRAFT_68540 [Jaapia argillacea MUCL 33604]|uniref:Uncharacterized protein n=1 Tax=Jaapia argillacea MUCL 33604 TaxID=933084 RepID=A0A067PVW8_9AGAM|nr:hypothetical protein JAAARDRAFT_68540 [Jaapia argillacea MUCL 33604]
MASTERGLIDELVGFGQSLGALCLYRDHTRDGRTITISIFTETLILSISKNLLCLNHFYLYDSRLQGCTPDDLFASFSSFNLETLIMGASTPLLWLEIHPSSSNLRTAKRLMELTTSMEQVTVSAWDVTPGRYRRTKGDGIEEGWDVASALDEGYWRIVPLS